MILFIELSRGTRLSSIGNYRTLRARQIDIVPVDLQSILNINVASKDKALRAIFLDRFIGDNEQHFIVEFPPPISCA